MTSNLKFSLHVQREHDDRYERGGKVHWFLISPGVRLRPARKLSNARAASENTITPLNAAFFDAPLARARKFLPRRFDFPRSSLQTRRGSGKTIRPANGLQSRIDWSAPLSIAHRVRRHGYQPRAHLDAPRELRDRRALGALSDEPVKQRRAKTI